MTTEIKANYIEKMGEPLGTQFAALLQEVAWLHVVWGEFVELFHDEPRVKVLNQAAPAMFRIILDSLWQFTLLAIARLMDRPGKKKLTIRNLPALVKPEVKADVKKWVDAAQEKSDFCRDRRNRYIAHLDLDLLTNPSARPLNLATKKKVDEALTAIESVLQKVRLHYMDMDGPLVFPCNVGGGGAPALLWLLQLGLDSAGEKAPRTRASA
jgi:AbiU2